MSEILHALCVHQPSRGGLSLSFYKQVLPLSSIAEYLLYSPEASVPEGAHSVLDVADRGMQDPMVTATDLMGKAGMYMDRFCMGERIASWRRQALYIDEYHVGKGIFL